MSRNYFNINFGYADNDTFKSVFYIEKDKADEPDNDDNDKGKCPIYAKLKSDSVDFSYYQKDKNHPIAPRYEVAWFSLPLDETEHTDHFLLFATEKELPIQTTDDSFRLYYLNNNKDFPNAHAIKNQKSEYIQYIGIREVLICLFGELDNPDSDICRYTPEKVLTSVKEKLKQSEVYKLIWKKFTFYRALYNYRTNDKRKEYLETLKVRYVDYLPSLLNDTIYNEIPHSLINNDGWFINPEEELRQIARINNEICIDNEHSNKVVDNYLLRKHAILTAFRFSTGKSFYPIVLSSLLSTIFFLVVWVKWFYNSYADTDWLLLLGVSTGIFPLLAMFLSARSRDNYVNLVMPRILVTITSVVFVLNITEELFLGFTDISKGSILPISAVVLILMCYFLFAENRQHSPIYSIRKFTPKDYNFKVLPIIIYSFNAANIITLVFHLVFAPLFIGQSNFAEKVFEDEIKRFEQIEWEYSEYQKAINTTLALAANGQILAKGEISKGGIILRNINDSSQIFIGNVQGNNITDVNDPNNTRLINTYLKSVRNREKTPIFTKYIEREIGVLKFSDTIRKENAAQKVGNLIRELNAVTQKIDSIRFELFNYKSYRFTNDALKALITYPQKQNLRPTNKDSLYSIYVKDSIYLDFRQHVDSVNIIVAEKNVPYLSKLSKKENGNFEIYPTLLIIQVLLSLMLGIVGQLIVSDKSVTEPL